MIPLYPPSSKGEPAFHLRRKWRSLVQLITPVPSRRGSFDLLGSHADDEEQGTTAGRGGGGHFRRPSAPAVLHDLRNFIPDYIRRYQSGQLLSEESGMGS